MGFKLKPLLSDVTTQPNVSEIPTGSCYKIGIFVCSYHLTRFELSHLVGR